MARYDPLTGLPNRRLLLDRIEKALQYAKRNGKYMAVLHIDLDSFESVNDRFGHACGDILLEIVARRLSDRVRQADTAGRLGGDELVMVLCELAAVEDASVPASKIIQSLLGLSNK
jgi:diguanylate cyclase (GGDEF)-like protein